MSSPDQPAPSVPARNLLGLAWRQLREMRTVFPLLVLIAAGALLSVAVPQGAGYDEYADRYGRFAANLIGWLSLDHVPTAWWFLLLLGVLLLSLIACSGRLWREGALRWRVPDPAAAARCAAGADALSGAAPVALPAALTRLRAAARRHGYRSVELGSVEGQHLLVLHRHRLSAWGQTLAHYAVFLVAVGAALGAMHGLSLDQTAQIEEGKSYAGTHGELPFTLQVDRFTIMHDPTTGSVANYCSEVRLFSGGGEVARGTISVNHPLKYRGYLLSQVSWGLGHAQVQVTCDGQTQEFAFPLARLQGQDDGGEGSVWGVPHESSAALLPDGRTALVAAAFFADARREGGEVLGLSGEVLGRPALGLALVSGLPAHGQTAPAPGVPPHQVKDLGWVLEGETLPLPGGQVRFTGVTMATGLGVRKDPGLPLVWAGFTIGMVGLVMIFYFPLQRRVLALAPLDAGHTRLTLATYGRTGGLGEGQERLWTALLVAVGGTPDAGEEAARD
ncbi:cytochrome c biogenesis protein ResB [bacterium]|nr:cytochrome c biogenesis protein ResB [bacterium]